MNNINLTFTNPYLLLLIIPGIILAFIPYFKLKKNRRRTRNRITSLVLHILIIICSVLVLSGIKMNRVEQVDSQIVLLLDKSISTKDEKENINEYAKKIVKETSSSSKIGLLGFGYGKCYYTKLDYPSNIDVEKFDGSISINKTGSDIENAFSIAYSMFDYSNSSKKRIVLLSDGIQTDGNVLNQITTLVNNEIEVDAIYFEPTDYTHTKEIQIEDFILPEKVVPFAPFKMELIVNSHLTCSASLRIYDNDELIDLGEGNSILNLTGGLDRFVFDYTLKDAGLHILKVEIESKDDLVGENNTYYSFVNIDDDKKILLIANENDNYITFRNHIYESGFEVDVVFPSQIESTVPDANALSIYGEVILMNMNVSSLPSDYASELKYYVETLGGGLLTTGGENTYALGGFKDTLYSELLPVEVEPNANNPRAIVICVDISNSMFMKDVEGNQLYSKPGPKEGKEGTRIDIARKGIIRSIDEGINPYDYIGIVVFGRNKKDINDTEMVLDLTPATHKEEIKAAVNSIQRKSEEGSTNYDEALTIAKSMLDTCPYEVNKKSVVLINDYDGNNDECETFETTIKDMIDPSNGENVINFSTIVVGNGKSSNVLKIEQITGSENVHMASNDEEFKEVVFDLCKSLPSDIYNYVNGVITPSLEITPITKGLNSFPEVESYNGTSAKSGAEVSVYYHNTNKKLDEDNEYVTLDNNDPIYAQWNYGLGKVGSAMIDFSTKGCSQLFVLDDGKIFVTNVLNSLYSNYNLTENEIRISVEKDNYNSSLNISILNNDDVNLKGEVITPFNEKEILELINVYDIDYIGSIETLTPGIYVLKVDKTDNNGKVLSSSISYVAFSYSKEYDTFYNMKDVLDCLSKLTSSTGGNVYYSTDDITLNIKEMSSIHIDMNLQLTLMIIALVLFLLDIASRKFNFLFPHEIIAKYKNKER